VGTDRRIVRGTDVPSDANFLPMVFDDDSRLFHGWMPFANGRMVSWSYTRG